MSEYFARLGAYAEGFKIEFNVVYKSKTNIDTTFINKQESMRYEDIYNTVDDALRHNPSRLWCQTVAYARVW